MNVNDKAKRILCFGDSLTYGRVPNKNLRYAPSKRWTGVLQADLGIDFEIIEEGLRSRTTDLDLDNARGRNGHSYFYSALLTHLPLDLLILMIGTNDLQEKLNRTVADSTKVLERYLSDLEEACEEFEMLKPKVLLLAPPIIDETHLKPNTVFKGAGEKSKHFAQAYSDFAQKHHLHFFDTSTVVSPDLADGVHLSEESNILLGEEVAIQVQKIFG